MSDHRHGPYNPNDHYDPNRMYAAPAYDAGSDSSINFAQPQPVAHGSNMGRRQTSNYQPVDEDYYLDRPSNIFTAPAPPSLHPVDPFDDAGVRDGSGGYGHNSYEMNQFHDYNTNFNQAFVPNVYGEDDDDEREFDERIQYGNFQGDSYDLHTVREPTPDHEDPPPLIGDPNGENPFLGAEGGADDLLIAPPEEGEQEIREPVKWVAKGFNGHLVLDCPVATELLSKFPDYREDLPNWGLPREFSHMRYTAVTCGPSNFYRNGFILRPVHYPTPRQTEMLVVITMYNEDDILLARTLKGVFKNIKHLESRTRSKTWGKDSWKKIVVCIVSDGRSKINERAQALLAGLGVYQEGLAKSKVDDRNVQAHIYEHTTRVGISSVDDTVKLTTEKIVPVQLLFCLKEVNAKKINSHRWCFQAISQVLDPNIVVLLDAGTQPSGKALYHLWKEFERDPQVAGACGEIKASLKKRQILTNPIVYGQNFEYKISNILDKPTESVFGFISVLPGAFSAYRNTALQNDVNGRGPLEKYFKGEFLHSSGHLDPNDDEYELKKNQMKDEAGIFTSNMYLAEDRILCYELVAKRGCSWVLRYCKSASAETDVPEGLAEFILQRRRWLNGSFFAAIYSLVHFPKIWTSSHSLGKKIFFHIEFFYQFLNLVVSWFSIGSYFLVFRILTTGLSDPALGFAPGKVFSAILLWLYLASIVTTFVLSFGNKPKGTEKFYVVIVIFFAILMAYMIFAAIFMAVHSIQEIYKAGGITVGTVFKNEEFRDLVVSTSSTYALYFIASFIYFEPWHMFTSFAQYILLSPAYINVLNIYAFCNIDDISWGTKGDTGAQDLGVATQRKDGNFDVSLPIRKEEVNQSYLNQLEKIKKPVPPGLDKSEPTNEDYYAFVRSMTVLVWMFSNFVIIAVVLETGGVNDLTSSNSTVSDRSRIFLTVILWTVAFMALFRFIGCLLYLIQRMTRKIRSRGSR